MWHICIMNHNSGSSRVHRKGFWGSGNPAGKQSLGEKIHIQCEGQIWYSTLRILLLYQSLFLPVALQIDHCNILIYLATSWYHFPVMLFDWFYFAWQCPFYSPQAVLDLSTLTHSFTIRLKFLGFFTVRCLFLELTIQISSFQLLTITKPTIKNNLSTKYKKHAHVINILNDGTQIKCLSSIVRHFFKLLATDWN